MLKRFRLIVLLLTLTFISTSVAAQEVVLKRPVRLAFATFELGSGWYLMGAAMAEVFQKALPEGSRIDVLPVAGGVGNPKLLGTGEVQIGLAFPPTSAWAFEGKEAYSTKITNLRAIAAGLDTYWIAWAVRAEVGLNSIEEIKERRYPLRLCTVPKGGLGEYATRQVLGAYGLSYKDIEEWGGKVVHTSFGAIASLIKDGRADAFSQIATPGHPTWTEIALGRDMRFLPLSETVIKTLSKEYGYIPTSIPAGTFKGMSKDVPTVGFSTSFICTADLSDDVVYVLTKALVENKDRIAKAYRAFEVFDPKTAWKNTGIPLHPGAEKYYKEQGWMP